MSDAQSLVVEGFVTDAAFLDRSKAISDYFVPGNGQVSTLTPQVLSYFTTPGVLRDTRPTTSRQVNWTPTTSPQLFVDETAFAVFVNTINGLAAPVNQAFFAIIDKLFFNYSVSADAAALESFLTTDNQAKTIYVPQTLSMSTITVADKTYAADGSFTTISVPSSASFSIVLTVGQTTQTYALTLYTSVDAWLVGYNISNIVKVVPPLPYDQLYSASLVTSRDNVFTTASLTATLSYNTSRLVLGSTVSGISEYTAVLTDGVHNQTAPFNILYKGRPPTLVAIRAAIQAALLASGVGTQAGWQARIPGVFVSGRFYIVPFWQETYQKPDQIIFPNVTHLERYKTVTNKILQSLGRGDLATYTDVLSLYYNGMTATAVPDLSGSVGISRLVEVIPDYQNTAPSDANFNYMGPNAQGFAKTLGAILTLDATDDTSNIYVLTTESLLTFYSFTVASYEVCVISKACYTQIMESSQ